MDGALVLLLVSVVLLAVAIAIPRFALDGAGRGRWLQIAQILGAAAIIGIVSAVYILVTD